MIDTLTSEGFSIDLSANIPVPFNFSISDITEPNKRKRNFSKSIKLEGTQNNCKFFQSAFSFAATESGINFDPTAKTSAVYSKRGIVIMHDAVIQLQDVVINDGNITFSINIFSETVDYFLILSKVMISELGWSEYDHILSRDNIIASWTAPIGSGYFYPLIERGNIREGALIWNTTDILPYIYFREILIKCLEHVGFTIDSVWLETTNIRNVLLGYGGGDAQLENINPADLSQRVVSVGSGNLNYSRNITFTAENSPFSWFGQVIALDLTSSIFSSTVVQDSLEQYSTTDVDITIQRSGNYTFTTAGVIRTSVTLVGFANFQMRNSRFRIFKNGISVSATGDYTTTSLVHNLNVAHSYTTFCQSGDVISFRFDSGQFKSFPQLLPLNKLFQVAVTTPTPITINVACIDTSVTDGSLISLFRFIPEIKCSDFLIGAIRQFNLYSSDPSEDGVIKIEPLIDYYSGTDEFTDISHLVDHSKDIKVTHLGNDYGKTLKWLFKDNKDSDNVFYKDKWGSGYGDYAFEQGSYYAKGDQSIQLPWSSIVPFQIAPGILVPRFITIDQNSVKPNKGAPRLCMRNGLKEGAWTFRRADGGLPHQNMTSYPCIHHFNNWNDPTFDLGFQLPSQLFYITNALTTNNCFVAFYSQFINEVISPASKFLSLYVYWTNEDVRNIDFGRLIMVNNSLYRLNTIKDFDDNISKSTYIELVKVLGAKKKISKNFTIVAMANTIDTFVPSPIGVADDVPFNPGGKNTVSLNTPFIKLG